MDTSKYKKLNNILNEHIDNECFDIYRSILDCYSVLLPEIYYSEAYETNGGEFSRKVPLQESINYVRDFLMLVDPTYAEMYDNLLYTVIDGEPIINFIPEEQRGDNDNCLADDGKVYIFFNEDINDAKTIVHEMFHKFNELQLATGDGTRYYNVYNRLFTETVSILAEKLFLLYLFHNGYITENDAALMLNDRIDNTFVGASIITCEYAYLKFAAQGLKVDEFVPIIMKEKYEPGTKEYEIWDHEEKTKMAMRNIVGSETMTYPYNISYIIGEYYSDHILDSEDRLSILKELNELICNPDLKNSDVTINYLEKRLSRQ